MIAISKLFQPEYKLEFFGEDEMKQKTFFALTSLLFTMIVLSACATATPTALLTPPVESIVGNWTGTMINTATGERLTQLDISIQSGCTIGKICGSYSIPQAPCGGNFIYTGTNGQAFRYTQQLTIGDIKFCGTDSLNEITLLKDGTLSQTWTDGVNKTHAILTRK
jgi:hypothetical protein